MTKSMAETQPDKDYEAKWYAHATAVAKSVALVIVCEPEGDRYAIFSTEAAANKWAEHSRFPCVVVSRMIVDEPEYGNAPKQ